MISDVEQTITKTYKEGVTQEECEDYCKTVVEATGCEYFTNDQKCDAFTYALHKEIVKGPTRCYVFEHKNKEARKRAGLPLTPGRVTKHTTVINTLGEGWEKHCFVSVIG